jgi:midasin (ATPase involved in ribosome maturation)
MLLGERLRTPESRLVVKEVLEEHLKVKINIEEMYNRKSAADLASLLAESDTKGGTDSVEMV